MREAESYFGDYYGRIYRFVRSRSGSDADAEDVTQTVFLEATAQLERLRRDSRPLLAWLYTVAQRRLIDAARRKRVHARHLTLDSETEIAAETHEYGAALASSIRAAIAALPEQQREALVLRLIAGCSFAEIGRATRTSESASKMRVARAVAAVRDYLEREGIEP